MTIPLCSTWGDAEEHGDCLVVHTAANARNCVPGSPSATGPWPSICPGRDHAYPVASPGGKARQDSVESLAETLLSPPCLCAMLTAYWRSKRVSEKSDGSNLPAKPPEIVFLDAAEPFINRWLDNQHAETERRERTDDKAINAWKEVTLAQMRDRRWYLWAGVLVLICVLLFAWAVKDSRIAVKRLDAELRLMCAFREEREAVQEALAAAAAAHSEIEAAVSADVRRRLKSREVVHDFVAPSEGRR